MPQVEPNPLVELNNARNLPRIGPRTCIGCGKIFFYTSRHSQGLGLYCSHKCAACHVGKITLKKNRRKQPKTTWVNKKCPVCGDRFGSWKSAQRKYCSTKCAGSITGPAGILAIRKNGGYSSEKAFSRCKRGFRPDIGITVRSAWEANYARYLNFLIKYEGKILKWEYEPETFWFESIKRGCRSYKPDFKVTMIDKSVEYHEVKGWMYPRAKTALKRMKKYHPEINIVLVDQRSYKSLDRRLGKIIKGWE